jgi:hypothetical protein
VWFVSSGKMGRVLILDTVDVETIAKAIIYDYVIH